MTLGQVQKSAKLESALTNLFMVVNPIWRDAGIHFQTVFAKK